MDEHLNILTSASAYFTPKEIEPILIYFGNNEHEKDQNGDKIIDNRDFEYFRQNFKSSFP